MAIDLRSGCINGKDHLFSEYENNVCLWCNREKDSVELEKLRVEVKRLSGIERKLAQFEKNNEENPGRYLGVIRQILWEIRKGERDE